MHETNALYLSSVHRWSTLGYTKYWRPTMAKDESVKIRMTADFRSAVERVAKQRRQSLSEMARQALAEYCARETARSLSYLYRFDHASNALQGPGVDFLRDIGLDENEVQDKANAEFEKLSAQAAYFQRVAMGAEDDRLSMSAEEQSKAIADDDQDSE